MADQDQNPDPDQTRAPVPPPKDSPFPKPAPAAGDPRRSSRITAPPEASAPLAGDPRRSSRITAPPEALAPVAGAANPRRTSRITLPEDAATTPADDVAGALPKTIRVVRPPAPGGMPPPQPGAHPLPPGPKPPSASQVQAAKSKTSRISLEAAIGGEAAAAPLAAADGAPKTIRLKRPSEMPTLKVPAVHPPTAVPPPGARATAPIAPHPIPSKTAPILAAEGLSAAPTAADGIPLTQKRTIRVKRPGAVSIAPPTAGGEAEPALTPLSPEESGLPVKDSCNPVFLVAAVAAILVTGALVFLFYQQLYGPAALY